MRSARRARLPTLLAALAIGSPMLASSDASLSVSIPNDQTKFRQGELIPLDLAFTAAISDRFSINTATYDRSGRMRYEAFVVNPSSGTADPLAVYFKAFRAFLGGGLTSFQYLSSKPFLVHLQLNEWARFDRLGVYHVSVISHRVADQNGGGNAPQPVELRSNELAIEIFPAEPAWQAEELAHIRTTLEQFPPTSAVQPDSRRTLALKRLRYLGSADAAREMARLFQAEDSQTDSECTFGLVGSPNRQSGLDEMRRLLATPNFPVSQAFLTTMSLLSLSADSSSETLPTKREDIFRQLHEELIRDLPTKKGSALARSASAAFAGNTGDIPIEVRRRISRQLIDSFPSLPIETRIKWLQLRWDDVKGPQWIPLLQQIASQYTDFPVPNEMHAFQSLELTGAALTNWYQLDPEGARPAIITEIERPKPRFNGEILGLLPDRTLPDVEQAIAQHFVEATDYKIEANLAGLLFRYADAEPLPVVLAKIQRSVGNWACAPQTNALAYVLKVDRNTAKSLIERALSAREQTGCWHTVLTDVGSMWQSDALEEFAIDALSDKDAQLATDAARYLGRYGSSAAESELWAHYVDWSRKWKGRDAELRFSPVEPQTHVWDANLGQALAAALATGQTWLADSARLEQIRSLGTESIRQQMEGYITQAAPRPLEIQYLGSGLPSFQIAQYQLQSIDELEGKLLQFPKGTSFVFSGPVPKEDAHVVSDLKTWAQKRNIEISEAPPH